MTFTNGEVYSVEIYKSNCLPLLTHKKKKKMEMSDAARPLFTTCPFAFTARYVQPTCRPLIYSAEKSVPPTV